MVIRLHLADFMTSTCIRIHPTVSPRQRYATPLTYLWAILRLVTNVPTLPLVCTCTANIWKRSRVHAEPLIARIRELHGL